MANPEFSEHEGKGDNPNHPSWVSHLKGLLTGDDALQDIEGLEGLIENDLNSIHAANLDHEEEFHPRKKLFEDKGDTDATYKGE